MNNSSLIFSIEVARTQNGKTLKALEPNSRGVYEDIPLGVIGQASRNNVFYEVPTVLDCMTNPNKVFYKRLTEGNLRGENGHPIVTCREELIRITKIDMTKVSHAILKIRTKPTENEDFIVIYGDIKPTGPYGPSLDKELRDPDLNTCFSLRSLTTKPVPGPNNVQLKKMVSLITFDTVDMPGYEVASKRYSGIEELTNFKLNIADVMSSDGIKEALGMESNDIGELYDILGSDSIKVGNIKDLIINIEDNTLIDSNGKAHSVFHTMFN